MIKFVLGRVSLGLAAAAVLATSAAVFVVALAFALFALVRPDLGPAGAAAVVAAAAALLALAIGLILLVIPRPKPPKIEPRGKDVLDRITNFVRDAPIAAVVGAVAVGFLAIRNPGYLGAAIRSFLEGGGAPRRSSRRR